MMEPDKLDVLYRVLVTEHKRARKQEEQVTAQLKLLLYVAFKPLHVAANLPTVFVLGRTCRLLPFTVVIMCNREAQQAGVAQAEVVKASLLQVEAVLDTGEQPNRKVKNTALAKALLMHGLSGNPNRVCVALVS